MIPGPVYHFKCPQCGCIIQRRTLRSANSFGGKFYSDGKMEAPMWPHIAEIGKCKKCHAIFWPHKQETVARYRWDDPNIPEVDFPGILSVKEYFKAIETGLATTRDEEFYIRQQVWWWRNDLLRDDPEDPECIMNAAYEENCRAMLGLLNYSVVEERITMAELYRNLGEFDECRRIISRIRKPFYSKVKKAFIAACEEKNRVVFRYEEDL